MNERAAALTPDPEDLGSVKEFGAALSGIRLAAGLSVRDVARRVPGIPTSTLGGYFAGRHLPPPTRPEVLTSVLTALGVPDAAHSLWHRAAQGLHTGRLTRVVTPNPYRGLSAYRVEDRDLFFGRDALTAQIVASIRDAAGRPDRDLDDPPIVVVLGPSGSGKSSVLRAGVIPALSLHGYAVLSPHADPLDSLAAALTKLDGLSGLEDARPAAGRESDPLELLVVDQLEQLWTLAHPSEREVFLEALARWASAHPRRVVVCCLRADFFASATESPVLLTALRHHQIVVGPMSQSELRGIITKPAEAAGIELAPSLVDHMLADADPIGPHGAVSVLPHLSHALFLMWVIGDRRRLTGDDYARVGGIRGSVTRSADSAYAALPEGLRVLARRVLLRLVVVEPDTMPTGAVVPMPTLLTVGDPIEVRRVLDHFADSRILTLTEEGCRFSHEAVIDRWELLREWIAADRTRLAVAHLVDREAQAWSRADGDPGMLLRGRRLRSALDWAGVEPPPEGSIAARYLAASSEDEQRVATERERAHGRVRRWLAATVVLALVTTGATVVSVRARQEANRRTAESVSRQIAVAAAGLTMVSPALGHQLSVAGVDTARTSDALGALFDASAGTQVARYLPGPGQRALAADPGRGIVAVTGPDAKVHLFRAGDLAHPISTADVPTTGNADSLVFAAAFSPDGRTLAVGGMSANVRLLDTTDPAHPKRIADLTGPDIGTVYSLVWSPDGTVVAAGTEKAGVQRWRVGAGQQLLAPIAVDGVAQALAVVPGTDELVVGSSTTGEISVWRGTGVPTLVSRATPGAAVVSLAVRPDGAQVAAGTQTGVVFTMPYAAGKVGAPTSLPAGVTWINALAWSPNGTRLYAASSDLTVRSWDRDGMPGRQLALPGLVTALAFADDSRLIAGLSTGEVDSWRTDGPEIFPDATSAFSGEWVGDGSRLVVFAGRPVRAAIVYDTSDPMHPRELGRTPPVPEKCGAPNSTGSTSKDAGLVVLGTSLGCLIGYDLRDPARPVTRFVMQPSEQAPQQIRVGGDGSGFLSGGDDHVARWWSVSGENEPIVTVLEGPTNGISGVELSADGNLAAAASLDHTAYLWEIPSEAGGHVEPEARITLPEAAVSVAFDDATQRLAVSGSDPVVAVYDISARRSPRQIDTLTGLTAGAYGVAFDAAGNLGAALSNGRVVLWRRDGDAYRDRVVLRAGTTTSALMAQLAWHPDGKHLLGVGTAGASRVWIVEQELAEDFICRNAGVPMTSAEWSDAVTGVPFTAPCPTRP